MSLFQMHAEFSGRELSEHEQHDLMEAVWDLIEGAGLELGIAYYGYDEQSIVPDLREAA